MVVGLLQPDVVERGAVDVDDAQIADLQVGGPLDAHAPAVGGGVFAHALEGHVARREVLVAQEDVAVLRVGGIRDLSDHADDDRTRVLAFGEGVQDGLDAHAGIGIGASHRQGNGVLGLLGEVQDDRAGHGRAIQVVGAGDVAAGKGKTGAVEGADREGAGGDGGFFRA